MRVNIRYIIEMRMTKALPLNRGNAINAHANAYPAMNCEVHSFIYKGHGPNHFLPNTLKFLPVKYINLAT